MSVILMIIGIGITIFALVTIHLGNKVIDKRAKMLEVYELSLLELKKTVEDLDNKVKGNSIEKLKELEKMMKECDRRGILLDSKIKEGYSLNGILERNFDKISEVKVDNTKSNFAKELEEKIELEDIGFEEDFIMETKEVSKEEILDLYKEGKGIKEISEITGKSLEDIGMIMGI